MEKIYISQGFNIDKVNNHTLRIGHSAWYRYCKFFQQSIAWPTKFGRRFKYENQFPYNSASCYLQNIDLFGV
ncbi:hypothetical protein BABINDRAFT_154870 [Babjeviella inositovora NRRL Y-12698]|uniref:Uncharacterized protein n=1 Tax=Babjeviella inositovora NRRL Y-12698 TaxID=984486 RepID=A0A1E3QMJ3_9ASCO|nr:uncharacterized protein BABINDRAFT_154870 [Babjeviella inositovora NRRL Y-12698]ODQ78903.1 hypothetical protein BABINDRAFT_154870 [Babjeviella inositovora NRRL Y-12698]